MKTRIIKQVAGLILIASSGAFSQTMTDQPQIGKRFPDFTVNDVGNFSKNRISLDDFKGKWLFLDFWTLTCKACIASFPKIDRLQKEFSKDIQFLLLGKNDSKDNRGIERFYEKKNKDLKLTIAAAFDSLLIEHWNIRSVPHIYVVDPSGILRFITDGRDMIREKILRLLYGEEVSFYPKDTERPIYDLNKVVPGDLPNDKLLYYSVLTKWNGERQRSGFDIDKYVTFKDEWKNGWSVAMVPLYALYNYAYFGRWDWLPFDTAYYENVFRFPILEVSDSSLFQFDYSFDPGKGTFNYGLKIPDEKISQDYIMDELKICLKQVFGFQVSIEKRAMPVWNLIGNTGAAKKLKSDGGAPFLSEGSGVTGFTIRSHTMKDCLDRITPYLPNKKQLVYMDKTGISGTVDMTIDADMTSYESVREELQKYGLDLLRGTREMKVIVIKDAKQ